MQTTTTDPSSFAIGWSPGIFASHWIASLRTAGSGSVRAAVVSSVTAEEKGLLGSEFYADIDPALPLENTVVNLNIDMIGRHDPTNPGADSNYVYIIGSNLISEELHEIKEFLADPRRLTGWQSDALWLRLTQVGRALASRTYSAHDSIVFAMWPEGDTLWQVRASGGAPAPGA